MRIGCERRLGIPKIGIEASAATQSGDTGIAISSGDFKMNCQFCQLREWERGPRLILCVGPLLRGVHGIP